MLNYKKWPSDSSKGSGTLTFWPSHSEKVCYSSQARPARYNLSMVCLYSRCILDTDVIDEMVNASGVEDFQLTPNQIWYKNSNFVYIGRTAPKSV